MKKLEELIEQGLTQQTITLSTAVMIVVALLVSLAVGYLIAWIYKRTFQGVVYRRAFGVTLIGMCVLTCMVTLAISTNVVLSLGMVGALSIVRYRTAVKDPMDLLFLFWSITTGITVGATMFWLALVAFLVMLLVVSVAAATTHKGQTYILVVHYTGEAAGDAAIQCMGKQRYAVKSKVMRKNDTEMTMEVFCKNDNFTFAEQMREVENINDVTLIQYDGEYHG